MADKVIANSLEDKKLKELNEELFRLARKINQKLYRTERQILMGTLGGLQEPALRAAQQLAGKTSTVRDGAGMSKRFSTRKATTIKEAQERIKDIEKALTFETLDARKAKQILMKRKKVMEKMVGKELTLAEFNEIISALESARQSGLDSDTIIQVMQDELIENKFDSVNDLVTFLRDSSKSGRIPLQAYKEDTAGFNKAKYNPKTGKWEI